VNCYHGGTNATKELCAAEEMVVDTVGNSFILASGSVRSNISTETMPFVGIVVSIEQEWEWSTDRSLVCCYD
jgi:hypothetical protein